MRRPPLFALGSAALVCLLAGCSPPPCASHDDCPNGYVCVVEPSSSRCLAADVRAGPSSSSSRLEPEARPREEEASAGIDARAEGAALSAGLSLRGELLPGVEASAGGAFRLEGRVGPPVATVPLTSSSYRLQLRLSALR